MKLRPTKTAFGCFSLLVGVQVICVASLVTSILLVAVCSSTTPMRVMGVTVTPGWQVLAASWAWVGIPIVIVAGVGAVYRVAANVMILCNYLVGSFCLEAAGCAWLLMSGNACSAVVAPEIQRMGAGFVCGFTNTAVVMWALILGLCHLYVTWVVWSAAQELQLLPQLQLIQYGAALESVQAPKGPPSGFYPLPNPRAEPVLAPDQLPLDLRREQPAEPPPGRAMPPTSGEVRESQLQRGQPVGEPQSFIPSPPSGVDFASSRAF